MIRLCIFLAKFQIQRTKNSAVLLVFIYCFFSSLYWAALWPRLSNHTEYCRAQWMKNRKNWMIEIIEKIIHVWKMNKNMNSWIAATLMNNVLKITTHRCLYISHIYTYIISILMLLISDARIASNQKWIPNVTHVDALDHFPFHREHSFAWIAYTWWMRRQLRRHSIVSRARITKMH